MASTYKVVTDIPGYYTSMDAKKKRDKRTTVHPATYHIYKEANGMINVTSQKGSPGSWINPDDNKKPKNEVTAKTSSTKTSTTKSSIKKTTTTTKTTTAKDTSSTKTSSSGTNKKVYRITKDYIPCYIINTLTGNTIEFDVEPDEITESNSSQFDPQDIRGRSSPYQGYNSSGPRTVNFELVLHHDLCKDGILTTVNHLRSLTYPGYGGVLRAPECVVRLGDMIHMKAIVNDVGITWQKPYRDNVYLAATVSLSFTEVTDTPKSASDIWKNGGFI